MKKSIKIGLTCCMGGLTGAFTGLQFDTRFGFVASIIVGFIAGYLLWELKSVFVAIITAYRYACNFHLPKINWEKIKIFGLAAIAGNLCIMPVILAFSVWSESLEKGKTLSGAFVQFKLEMSGAGFFSPIFYIVFMALMGFMMSVLVSTLSSQKNNWLRIKYASIWMLKYMNPILFPFTALYFIIKAIVWVVTFLWKFGKRFFFLIHSEERIVCASYCAIGAGIGYIFDYVIIGGLTAGILGFLGYKIITIKILKIQPKS